MIRSDQRVQTIRFGLMAWLLIVALAAGAAWAVSIAVAQESEQAQSETGAAKRFRVREGTKMKDQVGSFTITGDRAKFTTSDGNEFIGLENLNLARVMATIRDDPGKEWSVSGLITEYQGHNYVLITRAILKARSDRSDASSRVGGEFRGPDEQTGAGSN